MESEERRANWGGAMGRYDVGLREWRARTRPGSLRTRASSSKKGKEVVASLSPQTSPPVFAHLLLRRRPPRDGLKLGVEVVELEDGLQELEIVLLCLSRLAEEERLVPRLLHGVERVRAARTPTKGERGEVRGDEAQSRR